MVKKKLNDYTDRSAKDTIEYLQTVNCDRKKKIFKTSREGKIQYSKQFQDDHLYQVVASGQNRLLKVNEKAFEEDDLRQYKELHHHEADGGLGTIESFMEEKNVNRSTKLWHQCADNEGYIDALDNYDVPPVQYD